MNLTLCSAMCSLHRERNVISNQNEDICVAEVQHKFPYATKTSEISSIFRTTFFCKILGNVFN